MSDKYYVARKEIRQSYEVPEPEKRTLSVLISPELDPTNKDIAMGKTEMIPGCKSDLRGHPEGELFYCLRGKGTVLIEDTEIILEQDEAVYVPPNAVHQLISDQGVEFDLLWILTPPFGGDKNVLDKIKLSVQQKV